MTLFILAFTWLFNAGTVDAKSSALLKATEKTYAQSAAVQMNVQKTTKLKLLQKEKQSSGVLYLKHGGNLRWDTNTPNKAMLLITKKAVWMVDYPSDPEEKIVILKAANPRKSQPHALVAFLMGSGSITDNFTVKKEKKLSEEASELWLEAKDKDSQISKLTLKINSSKKWIDTIIYEDASGNETTLSFSDVNLEAKIEDSFFKFDVPPNSDVTKID